MASVAPKLQISGLSTPTSTSTDQPSSGASSPLSSEGSTGTTPASSVPGTPKLPAFDGGESFSDRWAQAFDSTLSRASALPVLVGVPVSPETRDVPTPAAVHDSLPLPFGVMPGAYSPTAAPQSAAATPSAQLVANLLAHDRTLSMQEPLRSGQFDLHGLGWEKYYKPLAHVSVDIKPDTRTSVHMLLGREPKPLALPQLLLASVALFAANLVLFVARMLGQGGSPAGAAASKLASEKLCVEQAALRFSKPVHAYPAGWNPSVFRIEFDGADVNAKGEIVPQGRFRLFNLVPLPGVGLAKSLLPELNVEADALARDGLFKITAPKVEKKKPKAPRTTPKEGGIPAFLADVLPETVHMRASGPKGDVPVTFPLSLAALGSSEQVLVELKPHGAQWQLEVDTTQAQGTPDARLVASLTATLHHGDDQAQVQFALGATTAPKRWPLATPVPNLTAGEPGALGAASVAPASSKLGRLLDSLHKGSELEAHMVVGTRLQGETQFFNLLGDTHVGRKKLDATHTRYRVVQGTPSAERTEKLAAALGIELPVLTDLGARIAGFEAQVTLAHPAAKASRAA